MSSTPTRHEQTPAGATTCACATRRDAFRAAGTLGVVAVGGAALTACGAAEDAADTAGSAVESAASGAASAGADAVDAIQASTVPVGGGTVVESLKVVLTQPTEGDFKAFSAVCPHQGCTVSSVADGKITCPCHGSEFDITSGNVVTGPATSGLEPKNVEVGDGGLTVT